MLHKLFGPRKRKPRLENCVLIEERSSALKIICAGGRKYYMAVPASGIMEKQPSFVLTRPEVFGRPWDSVVLPEEILVPGQKFRIRKAVNDSFIADSFVSKEELY